MGDQLKRWLVPDTPRRKAWQALLYLVITALALTAAGVKYASTSHQSRVPSFVSTTAPGDGGAKIQGTKGQPETPAPGRTVVPSRSYPASLSPAPSHRTTTSQPAASPSSRASVTATPSASVTVTTPPPSSTPAPTATEPSASPSAPSATPSSATSTPPDATTGTPAPGGLR